MLRRLGSRFLSRARRHANTMRMHNRNGCCLWGRTFATGRVLTLEQMEFEDLTVKNLDAHDSVREGIQQMGINELFPIQKVCFDEVLAGNDVLARSKTGTGKTLAFGIPILHALIMSGQYAPKRNCMVLVIEPTRELAEQVTKELLEADAHHLLYIHPIVGGLSMGPQVRNLDRGCHIVVGTPGRLLDHLGRGTLKLEELECVVLDESDELLRMGFKQDVESILSHVPRKRRPQMMLFSATLPSWVRRISRQFMNDHVEINVDAHDATADNLRHKAMVAPRDMTSRAQFIEELMSCERSSKSLLFCETKRMCESLTSVLQRDGWNADFLHGDLSQAQRSFVTSSFKNGDIDVLVATAIAARGLDIPSVDLVVQTEIPEKVDDFVHRAGRTARAGASGTNVLLMAPEERCFLDEIRSGSGALIEECPPPNSLEIKTVSPTTKVLEMVETSLARETPAALSSEDILQQCLSTIPIDEHESFIRELAKLQVQTVERSSRQTAQRGLLTGHLDRATLCLKNSKKMQRADFSHSFRKHQISCFAQSWMPGAMYIEILATQVSDVIEVLKQENVVATQVKTEEQATELYELLEHFDRHKKRHNPQFPRMRAQPELTEEERKRRDAVLKFLEGGDSSALLDGEEPRLAPVQNNYAMRTALKQKRKQELKREWKQRMRRQQHTLRQRNREVIEEFTV